MRAALGWIPFSPNSAFLMLNAHHAAVPSCDLLNVYDLKSSSVSERIIMENVTCNPLLPHSAGHVIDFQKKKVIVQILLGKSGEKLLLTAVKSWPMRLWFGKLLRDLDCRGTVDIQDPGAFSPAVC